MASCFVLFAVYLGLYRKSRSMFSHLVWRRRAGPENHTNIKEYFPEAGFDVSSAAHGRKASSQHVFYGTRLPFRVQSTACPLPACLFTGRDYRCAFSPPLAEVQNLSRVGPHIFESFPGPPGPPRPFPPMRPRKSSQIAFRYQRQSLVREVWGGGGA